MRKNRRKKSDERGSSSSSEPTLSPRVMSPRVAAPPLEWEDGAQCLGPILRYNSLPLVVTCDRSCLPPIQHVNFDFSQPLMLHTRRTVRKVLASNVVHVPQTDGNPADSRLKEVGDRLLIPEDYRGWFAVLGHPSDVGLEKVIPHFRQVAQLALSKCESFLIGGNEPVRAVQLPAAGSGADAGGQTRLLYPGDVLRMGKLYVGETVVKVKKPLFGGKKTVTREEKYLLCTDDTDRDVYLPVESRGTFYLLTTEGNGSPRIPIMRMKNICTHFRFPRVIKLVYGRVPATPCSFTGTLVLRDSQIESSVIGCTMLNLRNILLDLPVDTDLRFFVARSTLDLLSSQAYKNGKALCHDKAATYMKNMKVAYYVSSEEDLLPEEREGEDKARATPPDSVSVLSRPRPSIVEDQELFCPPETTPKSPVQSPPTPNYKASKKSVHNSETNLQGESAAFSTNSPPVLKRDKTYNLPDPPESLPLKSSKSTPALSVGKRPLPPIVSPVQCPQETPSDDHYMSMEDATAAVGARSAPAGFSPQTVSKTPPPTPPKPRKPEPHSRSESDNCVYMQVWNGEAKTNPSVESVGEEAVAEPSPVRRPKRLDVSRNVYRISSIALADTYLTLPVFKQPDASPTTPSDEYVSPSENARADSQAAYYNTASMNRASSGQTDQVIYNVPNSLPAHKKQRQKSSTANDQPYEVMATSDQPYEVMATSDQPYEVMATTTQSSNTHTRQGSCDEQKAPRPPPKTWLLSSPSFSSDGGPPKATGQPAEPACDSASGPDKIVFKNPPWMFREPSSVQSCEYASRWLSSQHQPPLHHASDSTYVHMRRDSFTYYEGYEPNKEQSPEVNGAEHAPELQDSSLDQNEQQAEKEEASGQEESGATYANIENLRPCQERLSVSKSVSDISDDHHARFLDKLANPPTVFGYIKAPPPRPVTPKKPPPVPKKPSYEKIVIPDEVFSARPSLQSGCNGAGEPKLPVPPKPCKAGNSASFTYLHPCPHTPGADPKRQSCEDSNNNNAAARHQSRITSICSDASHQSSEDDLPLGATFVNFLTRASDSGCALDSAAEGREVRGMGGEETDVSSMSVADLGDALKNVGLTNETVRILRQEKVDGRLLASLDEEELKETLSGIKKLDIKKIQMFVNGWRPME